MLVEIPIAGVVTFAARGGGVGREGASIGAAIALVTDRADGASTSARATGAVPSARTVFASIFVGSSISTSTSTMIGFAPGVGAGFTANAVGVIFGSVDGIAGTDEGSGGTDEGSDTPSVLRGGIAGGFGCDLISASFSDSVFGFSGAFAAMPAGFTSTTGFASSGFASTAGLASASFVTTGFASAAFVSTRFASAAFVSTRLASATFVTGVDSSAFAFSAASAAMRAACSCLNTGSDSLVNRRTLSRTPGRPKRFAGVDHASTTTHSPRSTGVLSSSWIENAVSRPTGRVASVATKNEDSSQKR